MQVYAWYDVHIFAIAWILQSDPKFEPLKKLKFDTANRGSNGVLQCLNQQNTASGPYNTDVFPMNHAAESALP